MVKVGVGINDDGLLVVTVFAGHPVVRLSKCGLRSDVLGRPLRMGILADVPLLRQGLLARAH